jgi:hypothetical protein
MSPSPLTPYTACIDGAWKIYGLELAGKTEEIRAAMDHGFRLCGPKSGKANNAVLG